MNSVQDRRTLHCVVGRFHGKRAVLVAVLFATLAFACEGCRRFDAAEDLSGTNAACCDGLGSCVPRGLIPGSYRDRLPADSCADVLMCVPTALLGDGDGYFRSCTVGNVGSEGRCLPNCLPEVASRKDLSRDNCGPNEVCAPCVNPLDGKTTGVCSLGSDPGPSREPVLFDTCCGGAGICVPPALATDEERDRLGKDSCEESDLCVPRALALHGDDFVPMQCTSAPLGAEGRCLPSCLPEVASSTAVLERAECARGELCVPCFDPWTGEPTRACSIGADRGPLEPPVVFDGCCSGRGRCLPTSSVASADRDGLDASECVNPENLCVPDSLSGRGPAPARCTVSATRGEGRCMPDCLPDVADRAEQLLQDDCAAYELCVPCVDPLDGSSTGACERADAVARPGHPDGIAQSNAAMAAVGTLGDCCGGTGRCVPQAWVDDGLKPRLVPSDCETSEAALCVPDEFLDPEQSPEPCTVALLSAEGRCLSRCLPEVAQSTLPLAKDGCGTNRVCVPCFDPVSGTLTAACSIGADAPQSAGRTFSQCCRGEGFCVPRDLVTPSERDRLAVDVCFEPDAVCAPKEYVNGVRSTASCTSSINGSEGRCLSDCLPQVAATSDALMRDGCAEHHMCVPCYDPLTAAATGACSLPGDPGPSEPPKPLPSCCGAQGACVPRSLVPAELSAQTGPDVCPQEQDLVCLPKAAVSNPDYLPAVCRDTVIGAEGRCLPDCLPAVASQRAYLNRADCQQSELCVPCFDPITGAATGACNFAPADPGPSEAGIRFADCCVRWGQPLGICVPRQLFPESAVTDTCGSGTVCVPREFTTDTPHLRSCVGLSVPNGGCVPNCMLSRAQWFFSEQGSCPDGYACTSCNILGEACGM